MLHPSPRLTGPTTPGAQTRLLSRLLLPPAQHEDEDSDYDDRCVSSSVVIDDDNDDHDNDEKEEPSHPLLGFESSPSYGRTRFGLMLISRNGQPPPIEGGKGRPR